MLKSQENKYRICEFKDATPENVMLGKVIIPQEILTTINRFHNTDSNVSDVISDALKDVKLDGIEVAAHGKDQDEVRPLPGHAAPLAGAVPNSPAHSAASLPSGCYTNGRGCRTRG